MNSYFLDTSIIIDYHKNKKEITELIDNIEGGLTSSYICLAELYEGIYRVKNSQEQEKAILNFFESLDEIFGLNQDIAKKFGELRAQLKSKGNIIEDMDLLIAATCSANGQILITHNQKHFSRIPDLKIYEF